MYRVPGSLDSRCLQAVRLQTLFILKRFEVNKDQIFSSEKIRNSGNCAVLVYNIDAAIYIEQFFDLLRLSKCQ